VPGIKFAQSLHSLGIESLYQSSVHSDALPARFDCPHLLSPRIDSRPTMFITCGQTSEA
jgi:hypothetical protein